MKFPEKIKGIIENFSSIENDLPDLVDVVSYYLSMYEEDDFFLFLEKDLKLYVLIDLDKTQINIMLLDYYCEEKWKVINILLKTILNATNCMLRVYDTNEKINTDKVKLNFSVNLDSNQTESPNPDDVEIKRLNQLSFVDRVEIFKDENRIVIYPKNRNINSVVVNNIALTK